MTAVLKFPDKRVRPAVWPVDSPAALALLQHYTDHLKVSANICLENAGSEVGLNIHAWSEPRGSLLLATVSEVPVGCVAVVRRNGQPLRCEMKRLWVEPEARGMGLGRLLVQAAAAWGRTHGAASLLLDTVPTAMPEACALYRSLAFVEVQRYNNNPVQGLHFMELALM